MYDAYPLPTLEFHFEIVDAQTRKLTYTPTALFDEQGEWEEQSFCDPRGRKKGATATDEQVLASDLGQGGVTKIIGKTTNNGHLQGQWSIRGDSGKLAVT